VVQVTDIKIIRVENAGQLRANATVTFDGNLVVRDFRVVESGTGKMFVSFPSRKHDGSYYDIVASIDPRFETQVKEMILSEWQSRTEQPREESNNGEEGDGTDEGGE
jgi:stage V sporulation protein G